MKKRTVLLLLSVVLTGTMLTGCAKNKATEDAVESEQTEKEGAGEEEASEETSKASTTSQKDDSAKSETDNDSGSADSSATDEADEEISEPAEKIAVLLPDSQEWSMDAKELELTFTNDGYDVEMLFADNDSSRQIDQIEQAMEEKVSAIVIAPVDAYSLSDVLTEVKEESIPVISYDDLIMDTNAVKYYVTFGGREIGQMIANNIVENMELDKVKEAKESKTIEFLMGSLDDTQALFVYNGVMEVLQPYFDDGTLVCPSGRVSFEDTGILRWSREAACTRMDDILNSFYNDGETPDIICTGFDDAALGAVDALEDIDLSVESETWPMVTGVGCSADGVKSIAEGKIFFSIFTDRRVLADQCEDMTNVYLHGDDDPEVNDYEQYDNGVKIIATYLCEPQLINKENYEILIDNGYYDEDEVRPVVTPTPTQGVTPTPTQGVTPTPTEEATPTPTEKVTPTDKITPTPTKKGLTQ